MDIKDFELLVRYEMDKYGLNDWTWKYNRATSGQCSCRYSVKLLKFCKSYVALNELHIVLDTILHEIAHALVGAGHGHGHVWASKCLEIGCRPDRFHRAEAIQAPPKWQYHCPECSNQGQYRCRNTHLYCGRCYRQTKKVNMLVWTLNKSVPNGQHQ